MVHNDVITARMVHVDELVQKLETAIADNSGPNHDWPAKRGGQMGRVKRRMSEGEAEEGDDASVSGHPLL